MHSPSISTAQYQSLPPFDTLKQTYEPPISHRMNVPPDIDSNAVADINEQLNELLGDGAQDVNIDLSQVNLSEFIQMTENIIQT